MPNPFTIDWNKNWTFQIVHMEGGIYLEAKGMGVLIRKPFLATESPFTAADNLVYSEDKIRKSLFKSWKSKKISNFN
ncbi:copper-binding protein [Prochlorococcus marinus]|uniref:copper-binding protein n=1 Tax=Prochlorococcus marinus TaxID=1219 RepID=UPI0022B37FB5|nr:copper-binding protein [Prochlorococcus marinus]